MGRIAGRDSLHEYMGNIHVHSRFSDGTGTVAEILRAGRAARLDYVIITDHRTLAARRYQGWHGELLLLVGEELGLQRGHYLGLGMRERSLATEPQAMIEAVARQGGTGFIAHPHDLKFFWPDWHARGFDGISVWNFTSQWRWSFTSVWAYPINPFFPGKTIASPPRATRALWDTLHTAGRLVPAIGCSDAHAFGIRPLGLPLVILPYRLLFRAINTHVLLAQPLSGRVIEDERSILEALRRGSSFVANHLRGEARGFRFWAEDDAGQRWGMGQLVPRGAARRLGVELPDTGWIVLIRDGQDEWRTNGAELLVEGPRPGVYRVEVYRDAQRKWGWVFSNPIRVL